MAGHSQFSNIKHRKYAQDAKRAKLFTKLVRSIITAAKKGKPDPQLNTALRNAIIEARSHNLPKDRIEKAIQQATTGNNSEDYEQMRYEGFAEGGIAILVEALTDNRNRTAADVRAAFKKHGGNLGETGSVSFMFDHIGVIKYPIDTASFDKIFELAAEAGAEDVVEEGDYYIINTSVKEYAAVYEQVSQHLGEAWGSKLIWRPQNLVEVTDQEKAKKLMNLIHQLEDSDDVQHVFSNYQLSSEISKALLEN